MNKLCCKFHKTAVLIEDYSAGDLICSVCALVVGDRVIDFSNEWRSFANDGGDDNCRVGAIETSATSDAATSITIKQSFDAKHLTENGEQKFKNYVVLSPAEKMIRTCNEFISAIADRLKLISIIKISAMKMVKKLTKIDGFTRKNKEAISAACLFHCCKENSCERNIKEFAAVTTLEKPNLILKMNKIIVKVLGLNSKSTNIIVQIPRFLDRLKVRNVSVEKVCIEIAKTAGKFVFKKPSSIMAGTIYMGCLLMDIAMTKENIKNVVGVSENTTASVYKILFENKESLIPESVLPLLKVPLNKLRTD